MRRVGPLVFLLLVAAVGLVLWGFIETPGTAQDWVVAELVNRLEPVGPPGGPPKTFSIEPGESLSEVSERLARDGVVSNPQLLRLLLRYRGVDRGVRAGRYTLPSDTPILELVRALAEGQVELVRVTVIEGWRAEEVAEALVKSGIGDREEFLRLVETPRVLPLTGPTPARSAEGFLFPETYLVPPDFGAKQFFELMLKTFEARVSSEIVPGQAQDERVPLTFYEKVVLASIVEREAKVPEERPLIAATFMNRLWEEMPLAADPTVQYALARPGEYWKTELSLDELKVDSPYNTYVIRGLPPTPIANPGLAAIKAVMAPSPSPYRYFVAKPDGSHAFAVTFDEHLLNSLRYQRGR